MNRLDPLQLDRVLRDTRGRLEAEYGTAELDYYLPPLRERWNSERFGESTKEITEDCVRKAIADIDREGVPKGAESTGYDLVDAGRRYPPKLVLSLAAKHASGKEFDRGAFAGGEKFFRPLGCYESSAFTSSRRN